MTGASPAPRRLGTSGLWVSPLTLGTMTFGGRTDEAEARRILSHAAEHGVFSLDTADTYTGGRSEEIVGRWLRDTGADAVLATKLGNPNAPGPNGRGLSRRWIVREAEASLRRLGRDHVDLLYLHKEDSGTRPDETLRALEDLVRAGKVRYWGLSNHKAWRIARFCERAAEAGSDPPAASQPLYHLLNRTAEVEELPVARAYGVGVISYSPTARGVLTGKYRPGASPPEGSRGDLQRDRMAQTEWSSETVAAAAAVADHARARNASPAAWAAAWALANPLVSSVIAGPRTMAQWQDYLGALAVEIGEGDEAFADSVVRPGCTARPQFTDPSYPVEGRPAARDPSRDPP